MAKRVSVYLNNAEVPKLEGYCRTHHCSDSGAFKSLLHQSDDEPTIEIVEEPNPVRDRIDGMLNKALAPLKITVGMP
jgi:hypothetical protein